MEEGERNRNGIQYAGVILISSMPQHDFKKRKDSELSDIRLIFPAFNGLNATYRQKRRSRIQEQIRGDIVLISLLSLYFISVMLEEIWSVSHVLCLTVALNLSRDALLWSCAWKWKYSRNPVMIFKYKLVSSHHL